MKGAHLQCMNKHCAKFEYKGMKTVGVTDYTNQTPLSISDGTNVYTHYKCENIFSNVHKIGGAHL